VNVFDSSALLAYLQSESGATAVRERLIDGGTCSAANWSEVAQKIEASEFSWSGARALLLGFGLTIEPVTVEDAESAALQWSRTAPLSLGDRLCLALGWRLEAAIVTCDRAWAELDRVVLIR
jgi:PIN domain nuclease of toxin-antitoxin system